MIQGARKGRKENPRNERKRKSLAAGPVGNTGPEGNILQLILKAHSDRPEKKRKKERRGKNGNELSDGKRY